MYKKPYSAEEKFAALTALERNCGNTYKTCRQTGVPASTLLRWKKDAEKRGELPINGRAIVPLADDKTPLADHLEKIVRQMVSVMPRRVEEASLQELTRSLTTILATMNQVRTENEQSGDVYDKFVRIMARFSNNGAATGDIPAPDGEGEG